MLLLLLSAPLVEELVFRGLLFFRFRRGMPMACAAALSAAVFGLLHGQWLWALYAAAIGFVFGMVCGRYGTATASLILHAAFNFSAAAGALLASLAPAVATALAGAASAVLLVLVFRGGGRTASGDQRSTEEDTWKNDR